MKLRKKLIECALPLEAINIASGSHNCRIGSFPTNRHILITRNRNQRGAFGASSMRQGIHLVYIGELTERPDGIMIVERAVGYRWEVSRWLIGRGADAAARNGA
jgi:hypothetical protein